MLDVVLARTSNIVCLNMLACMNSWRRIAYVLLSFTSRTLVVDRNQSINLVLRAMTIHHKLPL